MGGTDDPSNIVELTTEQHAHIHKRLYELYGYWQDKCAWKALSGQIGKEEIMRLINSNVWKGKKFTDEHKAKLSAAKIGKKRSPESVAKSAAGNRGKTPWNKGKTGVQDYTRIKDR